MFEKIKTIAYDQYDFQTLAMIQKFTTSAIQKSINVIINLILLFTFFLKNR